MIRTPAWRLAPLIFAALACAGCNNLFYFPSRKVFQDPQEPHRDVFFRTADGVLLHGARFFAVESTKRRGTVIQFHGNAGNLTSHYRSLTWVTEHGYDLLTFDYRGYGRSEGSPSPEGLHRDALATIALARSTPAPSEEPDLVLIGQSLGGAVLLRAMVDLQERARVRAVVVEGTFASFTAMAAHVVKRPVFTHPLAPIAMALVSDRYAPAGAIEKVAPIPLLVVHGQRDAIVPASFGCEIFALAREPKELWLVPGAGHIEALREPRFNLQRALIHWLDRTARNGPRAP